MRLGRCGAEQQLPGEPGGDVGFEFGLEDLIEKMADRSDSGQR